MPQFDVARYSEPLPHHVAKDRRYSVMRVLRAISEKKPNLDGLEGEVSQELGIRFGKTGGWLIPLDAPIARRLDKRDLTMTTGAGGVPTNARYDEAIDVLRSKLVCARLGARIVQAKPGKGQFPKWTTGNNVYWVAEGNAPTEAAPVVDQVLVTPNSLGAVLDVTRTLLHSPGAEAEIGHGLIASIAAEVDRVAVNGSGSGAEPLGLAGNTDITVYPLGTNGAAMTRADFIALELAIANGNGDATEEASMGVVTTPDARAKFRGTEVSSGSGRYLWGDDNQVISMPAVATKSLPANLTKGSGTGLSALVVGNFNDLIIAQWGYIEVNADIFSQATEAKVRFTSFIEVDVKLRHAESFRRIRDVLTA